MLQVLVTEQYLEDIADSIRAKNGSANTYTPAQMANAISAINTSGGGGGGGGALQGFELYAIDNVGGLRVANGRLNNNYLVCYFDDNMQSNFTLNGISKSFTITQGARNSDNMHTSTIDIENNTRDQGFSPNVLTDGSKFSCQHNDSGSYMSVVGGWVGYPSGGTIYASPSYGTENRITLNSAHRQLLIFIAATGTTLSGVNTVLINNAVYDMVNIGARYDRVYGIFNAFVISGNLSTDITVEFPQTCANYVSIIGID